MNVLEYNDSNYRNKQEQKEKDEFAIGFASWVLIYEDIAYDSSLSMREVLKIYKKTL
jgi:hypothetical protein